MILRRDFEAEEKYIVKWFSTCYNLPLAPCTGWKPPNFKKRGGGAYGYIPGLKYIIFRRVIPDRITDLYR